jgi:hypothetical protein
MFGMFNEMTYFNGVPETVQDMLKHYDEWGGRGTYPPHGRGGGGRRRQASMPCPTSGAPTPR